MDRTRTTARAELSSAASSLDDLVRRLSGIVDSLTAADRDGLGADLYEVERTLTAAQRRLARVVDAAGD